MKSILTILLFCLLSGVLPAQKLVEQRLPLAAGKKLVMNIQIANSIRIVSWNRNEVYAKASINLDHNRHNDSYITSFDAGGDAVRIGAKIKESHFGKDDTCRCYESNEIVWEIYMPEQTAVSVETIDGNMTIAGNTSAVKAKSISGFIDLQRAPGRKTSLTMNTVTGTIYTDLALDGSKSRQGTNSVSTELNGGGERVSLETISGDIFLRKE